MQNLGINRKLLAEDVNCKVSIVYGVLKSRSLDEIVKRTYKGERKKGERGDSDG